MQVACEFSLQQETLFIAVDLLDRFLTKAKVHPPATTSSDSTKSPAAIPSFASLQCIAKTAMV
jgi:hypothetical protein